MGNNIVIPNREWAPERLYKRIGKKIIVYSVIEVDAVFLEFRPGNKLFSFELPSEREAIQLMEDLHYGEYTGG